MTKEQEEAIRICEQRIIEPFYEFPNPVSIELNDTQVVAVETVLNMVKEKDKEIEQLKRDFEIVDQECSRLEKKEVKQEKIIELLVNKLNQNYNKVFESSEVKEIIEIYEKIKNISNLSGIKLRKECIKQYFERKVNSTGQ